MAVKLLFNDPKKFFVTSNASISPKYVITQARLYVMACLLDPASLLRVNARLAQGNGLQIPYLAFCSRSFAVEQGRLSCTLDISLKDPFTSCIGMLLN